VFDSFRGDLAVTRWILATRLTPLRENDSFAMRKGDKKMRKGDKRMRGCDV
jgi:hypothetical protein